MYFSTEFLLVEFSNTTIKGYKDKAKKAFITTINTLYTNE